MGGINIPQPKQKQGPLGGLGKALPLIGGAIGAAFGGPAGFGAGMAAGSAVGGALTPEQEEGPQGVQSDSAMSRRMNQIDDSPQMQLRQSIDSLKFVEDPAQRAELAKPLLQAEYLARQQGKA